MSGSLLPSRPLLELYDLFQKRADVRIPETRDEGRIQFKSYISFSDCTSTRPSTDHDEKENSMSIDLFKYNGKRAKATSASRRPRAQVITLAEDPERDENDHQGIVFKRLMLHTHL
jgi:hypothetical protein